jgi:hypothetical protein
MCHSAFVRVARKVHNLSLPITFRLLLACNLFDEMPLSYLTRYMKGVKASGTVVKKMVHVGADDLDIKPSSHFATPSRQTDLGLSRCVQGKAYWAN